MLSRGRDGDNAAGARKLGNMRRNVVYGPGFVNLDFSVIKDFKFGERFSLQLRGEFFNILNHPNFADPDHDLSDGPTWGWPSSRPTFLPQIR